jgi:hypothetical protein
MAELTFGQKAVGLSFNPANDPTVHRLKELYAEIIDIHNGLRSEAQVSSSVDSGEKIRLNAIAITEAQGSQMWSVKAATWGL